MALSRPSYTVVVVILLYIIVSIFGKSFILNGVEHEIGNRRRMVAIAKLELFILLANIFMYYQLKAYFEYDTTKMYTKQRDEKYKTWFLRCLLFVQLCSHAVYVMYYAPMWLQTLFFDVSSILAGLWTNIFGFVCGFFLVNTGVAIFQRFRPTSSFLSYVFRIRWIRLLSTDRPLQVKTTLLISFLLSFLMFYSSDKVIVREVTLPIRNFSSPDGSSLRLALVSDIHVGASVYSEQVRRVADQLLRMSVDAVVIVGDMVDGPRSDLGDRLSPLWEVASRMNTFFVTGNHDYYYGDVREWLQLYREKGIHVLHNSHSVIHGVCLAGVDDISSGKSGVPTHEANVSTAISGCPAGASRVLLAHNPATVKEIPPSELDTIDVILSGHTHAGQFYVVVPVVYWLLPYFYGQYSLGHGTLFVTAGTLYQGPPMKNIAMSQIWIVTLESQSA